MSVIRNRKVVKADQVQGGEGYILRDMLLDESQLHGECTYLSCITLEPGCSIGLHAHANDSEIYFMLEGEANYNDNGTKTAVQAGDVLYCPKGSTHSIANNTKAPVKFIALIQK